MEERLLRTHARGHAPKRNPIKRPQSKKTTASPRQIQKMPAEQKSGMRGEPPITEVRVPMRFLEPESRGHGLAGEGRDGTSRVMGVCMGSATEPSTTH